MVDSLASWKSLLTELSLSRSCLANKVFCIHKISAFSRSLPVTMRRALSPALCSRCKPCKLYDTTLIVMNHGHIYIAADCPRPSCHTFLAAVSVFTSTVPCVSPGFAHLIETSYKSPFWSKLAHTFRPPHYTCGYFEGAEPTLSIF